MASVEDKREKVLNLEKVLLDAIAATEKDINQCSLEWLQLCDINSKQHKSSKNNVSDVRQETVSDNKLLLADIENSTDINMIPIDISVSKTKIESVGDEEYDSSSD